MGNTIQSISQTIIIGKASTYLMSNDLSNGQFFGKRLPKPMTHILLQYVTDALSWQFQGNPSDPTLRGTANYAIWLYGIYGAQTIGNQGGGSVIPIPPISTPQPLEFYVSDSTPIANGVSSVTFLQFVGFNLQFNRGNQPQAMISDGTSTYFTWNKVTGKFVCIGAAVTGELFSIIPYV